MVRTEGGFHRQRDKILRSVPEEFRKAMATYAWREGHGSGREGHGSGYNEVLIILQDLINDLTPAIKIFEAR